MPQDIKVKSTIPFKLKDKDDRNWKAFNLKAQFGFTPESIIISKPWGMNNKFILSAVMPKEEIAKREKPEKK